MAGLAHSWREGDRTYAAPLPPDGSADRYLRLAAFYEEQANDARKDGWRHGGFPMANAWREHVEQAERDARHYFELAERASHSDQRDTFGGLFGWSR